MVGHDCSGTDVQLIQQRCPTMRIQPGICSGTSDQRCCKMRDLDSAADTDENVSLEIHDESTRVCPETPRLRTRLSSGSTQDREPSCGSHNVSTGTSYYSCVSQITIGFDPEGQVAIGISHWKRPYPLMCQALPSPDGVQSEAAAFPCLMEHAEPVSCPASLSITPLPSHCSSQDTISESSASVSFSLHGAEPHWFNLRSQSVLRPLAQPLFGTAVTMEEALSGPPDSSSTLDESPPFVAVKDAKILLEWSEGSGGPLKDDDSLLNPGTHSCTLDEPSSLDLASEAGKSKSSGLCFSDGKCRIDYVLVYKKSSPQLEKREVFERNIRAEGLQMEKESSITNGDVIFVKLHAPWEVLCRYAEIMNIRMPFRRKFYYLHRRHRFMTRLEKKMSKFRGWLPRKLMKFDDTIPDLEENESFTAPFSRQRIHHFIIHNKDTFFSNATRTRIVHHILQRVKYEEGKNKIGLNRLLGNNSYEGAFPLHEGSYRSKNSIRTHGAENQRHLLYECWAWWGVWYKYQPLDLIRYNTELPHSMLVIHTQMRFHSGQSPWILKYIEE